MPARSSNDNFDVEYNGYKAHFISAIPDPNYMAATPALCEYAVSQGVEFFGSMPAVQLVEDNGTVTGVIAGEKDSYTQFNAAKGVILCTGDYCCNPEMISTYCPDVDGFPPLTEGRDGRWPLHGSVGWRQDRADRPHQDDSRLLAEQRPFYACQ